MKRLALTLLTCIFLLCTFTTKAQDYRSAASGNWHTLGTWEESTDGGTTWVPATAIPNNVGGAITSGGTTNQIFPWTNTTHSLTLSGGTRTNGAGSPTGAVNSRIPT